MPVSPPISRMKKKPSTKSSGVLITSRPAAIVAIQQKICSAVGIAIMKLIAVKKLLPSSRHVGREHVMHPQPERQEAGGDQRQHDRVVSEHRAAGERRESRPR